jgi:hypothetical protein
MASGTTSQAYAGRVAGALAYRCCHCATRCAKQNWLQLKLLTMDDDSAGLAAADCNPEPLLVAPAPCREKMVESKSRL